MFPRDPKGTMFFENEFKKKRLIVEIRAENRFP
jgi:hypothetical protein